VVQRALGNEAIDAEHGEVRPRRPAHVVNREVLDVNRTGFRGGLLA
jgi:hypothetical protein